MALQNSQVTIGSSETTVFTVVTTGTSVRVEAPGSTGANPTFVGVYRGASLYQWAQLNESTTYVGFNSLQSGDVVVALTRFGWRVADVFATGS